MGIALELILGKRDGANFTCSVCTDLLQDAFFLKECEHYFCRSCIGDVIKQGNSVCPECRNVINPAVDVVNARFMRLMLSEFMLKCPEN